MAQAHITWEEQVGVISYTVQYKPYNAANWNTFSSVPAGTTSETITGLNENALYHFRILSVCEDTTCDIIQPIVLFDVSFSCPNITLTSDADSISYSFPKQGDEIDKYILRLYSGDGQTILETRLIIPNASNPITGTFDTVLEEGTNYNVQLTMYADWAGVDPHVCGMIGKSTTSPPAYLFWTFIDNSSSPEGRFILKFNGVTQVDTLVNGSDDYEMEAGTLVEVTLQGNADDPKLLDVASLSSSIDESWNQLTPITYSFTVIGGETYNIDAIINEITHNACADFGLSLSDVAGQSISLLKAGVITSTTGVVGEYVIDWYLNNTSGQPVFSSGSSGTTDPSVTVYHPFNNEPVEGGTYYPVIKFIYIDGIRYSRTKTTGSRFSPTLLNCLASIVIQNFSCTNANPANNLSIGIAGAFYGHKIAYVNNVNSPSLASRSFRFDLDATNRYFAWAFHGFEVRDRVKITHISPFNATSSQVAYWEVGSANTGVNGNVTSDPMIRQGAYHKMVTPLTSFVFAAGDYLLIEVIPAAISNTNWEFGCRCLPAIDCFIFDKTLRQIQQGSPVMTWNQSLCRFEVRYTKPTWSPIPSPLFVNLHGVFGVNNSQLTSAGYGSSQPLIWLNQSVSASILSIGVYASCAQLSGSITITKNDTFLLFSFGGNPTEYNNYKAALQAIQNHSGWADYTTDPTLINHYKWFYFQIRIGASCGDTQTIYTITTHNSNPPVFDDVAMTMRINQQPKSISYVPIAACDTTVTFINPYASLTLSAQNIWQVANGTVFNTSIGTVSRFGGIYHPRVTNNQTTMTVYYRERIVKSDVCNLQPLGWLSIFTLDYEWTFTSIHDRVTILDNSDPINNWRLERLCDYDTGAPITNPANYIKVYEKINGVVTVDTGFPV